MTDPTDENQGETAEPLFNKNLRATLEARGWSMRQCSLAAGLSKGFVESILTKPESSPKLHNAQAIAAALEMPLAELTGEAFIANDDIDRLSSMENAVTESLLRRAVIDVIHCLDKLDRDLSPADFADAVIDQAAIIRELEADKELDPRAVDPAARATLGNVIKLKFNK